MKRRFFKNGKFTWVGRIGFLLWIFCGLTGCRCGDFFHDKILRQKETCEGDSAAASFDVTGSWTGFFTKEIGTDHASTVTLTQSGTEVTGTFAIVGIADGSLAGSIHSSNFGYRLYTTECASAYITGKGYLSDGLLTLVNDDGPACLSVLNRLTGKLSKI